MTTVTSEETLESGALLESAISVVDPSVLEDVAICGHVSVVLGHTLLDLVLGGLED